MKTSAGKSCLVLGGLLLLATSPAVMAADDSRWSVSFSIGGHLPGLEDLNEGLYQSAFIGTSTVLVREGSSGGSTDGEDVNETETIPFRFDNPLPETTVGPIGAIEIAWHANDRHSFIFGFGSMESVTTNTTLGNLPVQQFFVSNVVEGERRGKISFTEYMLGWRYAMVKRDKFQLYSRLSIHEAFDIDYREEWTFLFIESPIQDLVGVRRNMVAEAESASLFMGQLGIGGEWFLTDWFSLGIEGGYMLGEREFTLRQVNLRDDFTAGDALNRLGLPYRQMPDGTLGYLNPNATVEDVEDAATRDDAYTPIRLGFDGWRLGFRISIYF